MWFYSIFALPYCHHMGHYYEHVESEQFFICQKLPNKFGNIIEGEQ